VECVRAEGNIAVVGYSWGDPIMGPTTGWMVIEDNGPAGDRVGLRIGEQGCPAPDASLLSTAVPVSVGDFVIDAA
jgi:hypothetical protein